MATSALIPEPAMRLESVERKKLLLISPEPEDREALRAILDQTQWTLSEAATHRHALQLIDGQRFTAIFCEAALNDPGWKDLLTLGAGPEAPLLVVISRLADEYLWCEVLNLGGYDVLATPFDAKEVTHVLKTISLQQSNRVGKLRLDGGFGAG